MNEEMVKSIKKVNYLNLQLTIKLVFICLFLFWGCSKYSDEVQANLNKLKKTKACPGCDLSGIELISFDLKGADLSGANLTDANLRRSDLTGANLTNTNLSNAELLGLNLTDATLINTNLTGVKLSYAIINGADITGSILKDAHMNSSTVVNSKIKESDMNGANLYKADLTGTKVANETLKDTVLCKTIMPSGKKNDSGCKN